LFPLTRPLPDFEEFKTILKGERKPQKVHYAELGVDGEIMEYITENIIGVKLPSRRKIIENRVNKFLIEEKVVFLSDESEIFCRGYIDFYYRMGYDYVPDHTMLEMVYSIGYALQSHLRETEDTAILRKEGGKRIWAAEGRGVITSWQDFENFPWQRLNFEVEDYYQFLSDNLPEGMKITVHGALYEPIMELLLGYEGLFYKLYEQPDLVRAVSERLGEIIYRYYKSVISLDCVGAIVHHDDLGYNTGTILNPDILRELVLPWHKKYAFLAHQYGKMYWYHCCGNVLQLMEDFIEDVKIDAFHSFQDVIIPVAEFKRKYGDRVAILGGVDMDKLSRLQEQDLREYVRGILNECMPGGRFALGSGNSIANYVPIKNYLAMLEEGLRWGY